MTLSVHPKPHWGNEVQAYLASTWTPPRAAQAPYRQVSVAEHVFNELAQSQQNQLRIDASTQVSALVSKLKAIAVKQCAEPALATVAPLWAAPLRNMAQLMDAQIHTTQGKTYTGGEVLADATVRMIKADGQEVLDLVGSAKTELHNPNAGILTGADLLNSMNTLPFLVGIGSMAARPKGTKVFSALFDRAKSIKTLVGTIADIEGQISSLNAKKVQADLSLRAAESQLTDRKEVVKSAANYGRNKSGYSAKVVRQTMDALKAETAKADAAWAQKKIESDDLAHQIKVLEGLLARTRQDLAGHVADSNMFLIRTEPSGAKSKRAKSK